MSNDKNFEDGMNTGFIEQPPRDTDYIAGSLDKTLGVTLSLPSADWTPFLPEDETQIGVYFDTMGCVSFSALNVIETQMRFMMERGLLSERILNSLLELGYINAKGEVNFSDRFTAKMSGTTKRGNSMVKVWDSIRHHGLLPESDWPYPAKQRTPVFDWDDYYAPIPQELQDKAKKFLELFDVGYEWLVTGGSATKHQYNEWLKAGPIQIAIGICSPWNTSGVVQSCASNVGHAIMLHDVDDKGFKIFDHYDPYKKTLASDYRIPYALRGVVVPAHADDGTDPDFAQHFVGDMVLAVEARGELWYVTEDANRIKIGRTPSEVDTFLQAVNDEKVPITGMTNSDLAKIPIIV